MTTVTISPTSKSVAAENILPRRPAKTSLHAAMNRFYDRDDAKLTVGTRQDYEHLLMMLEMYVDGFGSVMLRPPAQNRRSRDQRPVQYQKAMTRHL